MQLEVHGCRFEGLLQRNSPAVRHMLVRKTGLTAGVQCGALKHRQHLQAIGNAAACSTVGERGGKRCRRWQTMLNGAKQGPLGCGLGDCRTTNGPQSLCQPWHAPQDPSAPTMVQAGLLLSYNLTMMPNIHATRTSSNPVQRHGEHATIATWGGPCQLGYRCHPVANTSVNLQPKHFNRRPGLTAQFSRPATKRGQ